MGLPARVRRTIHNYTRLFAPPHRRGTLITLAVVIVIFLIFLNPAEIEKGIAAGFVFEFIILCGRQVWITDDYDKAEAAAAQAERVRQQAQRERETRRIPHPSFSLSYATLGLNENATDTEIKTAFRRLVKRYHPDRRWYSAAANSEKFRQVQEAYAELRNSRRF